MKQQNVAMSNSKPINYKESLGIGKYVSDKAIMTKVNTYINKIITVIQDIISELQRRGIFIIIVLILFGFLIHFVLHYFVGIRNGLKQNALNALNEENAMKQPDH